jgi:hypothetical protein
LVNLLVNLHANLGANLHANLFPNLFTTIQADLSRMTMPPPKTPQEGSTASQTYLHLENEMKHEMRFTSAETPEPARKSCEFRG